VTGDRRTQPEAGAFEREWRRRFERFARDATTEHHISGWSEAGLRRRIRAFGELLTPVPLEPGSRVLDLGSGAGTYVRLLGSQGYRAVGVDYSIPSLQRSIEADPGRTGRYLCGDAYSLPFSDESFELVVMIGIFQAMGEPARALTEARRVLRRGGHLVLEILNANEILIRARTILDRTKHNAGVRTYGRSQMRRLIRAARLRPLRDVPVFLPPRNLPGLEAWMDHPVPRFLLRTVPGFADLGAPSFLLLALREDDAPR
jgi:SAM-dependent methyltransferase